MREEAAARPPEHLLRLGLGLLAEDPPNVPETLPARVPFGAAEATRAARSMEVRVAAVWSESEGSGGSPSLLHPSARVTVSETDSGWRLGPGLRRPYESVVLRPVGPGSPGRSGASEPGREHDAPVLTEVRVDQVGPLI